MLGSLGVWNLVVTVSLAVLASATSYNETLNLTPLPRNKLLTSFQFHIESQPIDVEYHQPVHGVEPNHRTNKHYNYFPSALGPILESTNTRELHLRFTQGWWDSESWGSLPANGYQSGGTGVEMWAIVEAPDLETAQENWIKLSKTLSGFFCASLNFIDESITTYPKFASSNYASHISNKSNKLFLLRAALPGEPICTENLTPFLKLLPTRGKAGISSLLDGHKVFDSLWHGMSIDIVTKCSPESQECHLEMNQSVNAVVDITRSIRKRNEGGLPKPTPGDKLRCDESKVFNIWQCFPLSDETALTWSLDTIYGRKIEGPAFIDVPKSTTVNIEIDPHNWNINVVKYKKDSITSWAVSNGEKKRITYFIDDASSHDIEFETADSTKVKPTEKPPLYVSRSLTGYSLDKGGFRISVANPSDSQNVDFIYYETLPWYMRLYLNTLKLQLTNGTGTFAVTDESEFIKSRYLLPGVDRKRPSHLEFKVSVPPLSTLSLTYQFDRSLLLYHEYPPDANHGFAIDPAVITVLDKNGVGYYEARTTSILLTLPTPDFSMPYNVIILTCTVMSLAFGCLFNLLTKKVITEAELESLAKQSKASKIVGGIRGKIQRIKGLVKK